MNWISVKLSDLLIPREQRFNPNDKSIVGLKRIDKIDFSGNIYISNKKSNTDMILIKKGDLVISGINVSKGAMSVYQGDEDILATIHYSSYVFNKKKINVDFLKYFLKSSKFIQVLKEQVSGGIKTEIKPKHLMSLIVDIPETIEEQKYIINILDNYKILFDNLKYEHSQQTLLISKIKQQLLSDAVQGNLTSEWRKENTNMEPAVELLKRIKAEKEKLIKDKKIKKEKPLPPVSEDEMPFEIPKGWVWCRLGEIISFGPTNGYSPKATKKEEGIKCLTLTATTSGYFKENCYKIVDVDVQEESYLWLKTNDILLQRGNSLDYVGIAAIYEGEQNKYIFPDLMIKINVFDILIPKYIYYALISPFNRLFFQKNAYGTQKSMPKINQKVVLNTLIPLPPLQEQQAIVEKVESLLAKCSQMQSEAEKQAGITRDLLDAVFNEAFSRG